MSLAATLPTSLIGIWDFNVTKNIIRSNDRAALLSAVEPEAARIGRPQADFVSAVHPGHLDELLSSVTEAVRTQGAYSVTYMMKDAHGRIRTIVDTAACYESPEGDLMLPGTMIDVTGEQLSASVRDHHVLDRIARYCLRARDIAKSRDLKVLQHLLDMTMLDLSMKVRAMQSHRLRDWSE